MEITVEQHDLCDLINQPLIKGLLESISDGAIVISLPDRRIAATELGGPSMAGLPPGRSSGMPVRAR